MSDDPIQIAHYKITAKLGEGGMGAVYRATDTKLNREVAIKIIPGSLAADPDRFTRFTREAQILAGLNHPNIATIHGVEDRAIIMELVEGQPIAGPLTVDQTLQVINQLINALEYAHEKGIIHRDLKPANILLTPEGHLKVLDFGLAKALANEPSPNTNSANSPTLTIGATEAGLIMGTAAYMSPEQARGNPVDKRADIWAFGVITYELLTGRKLFEESENVSDILAAVLRQDIDPSKVPARFQRLIRLCLTRDPRQRLRDISSARLLLEEPAPSTPIASYNNWIIPAAALFIVAIVLGISWRATRPIDHPLTRFNVDLGPEAFSDPHNLFALSPDGRRIVYTARSTEGKQLLATRQLDEAKIDFLRGTENAKDPFFSPDGHWVAFFADGQMRKVGVSGGAPSVVTDVSSNPRGASWGPDGVIVFAAAPNTGLSRVSASGGPAQPITAPSSKGQATHRWPQFHPDGNTVIFTAHNSSTGLDDAEIDALDLKTGNWKTVQKGGYFGRYLSSGHLIYVRLGTLFAVRVDPASLETQGLPVPILDDVAANRVAAAGRFHFSPSTGDFAYASGKSDAVPARSVWLDRSGKAESVPHAGVPSPDGRLIAYATGAIGTEDIKIWDSARDVTTAITTDHKQNRFPVWTPDGRHIIYTSTVNDIFSLWWARSDGGAEPYKLLESKSLIIPASFSPDGRRLAYHSGDLWTLHLNLSDPEKPKADGSEPFLRGPDSEVRPYFSPDGRWIAYASQESGSWEIYVRPFPGPGGRWQVGTGAISGPRWSRAGRQLFFSTSDGRVMVCDYETRGDNTFLPGKPRLWTQTRVGNNLGDSAFELSADGQRILTYIYPAEIDARPVSVQITFLLNFFDELKRRLP